MADTTYTDNVTVITADTMNDLNRLHYTILGDPATGAAASWKLITDLTADAAPVIADDYVMTSDASASTGKKVLLKNLFAGTGNVGIGIANPSYKLVVSDGGQKGFEFAPAEATPLLQVVNRSTLAYEPLQISAKTIRFNTGTSPGEGARLDENGYLLVGYISSNGAHPLQVNGQIFATNATISTSDARYKQNIQPITGALGIVSALRPVSFRWKAHPVHDFDLGSLQLGFIAQEVNTALSGRSFAQGVVKSNRVVAHKGDRGVGGRPLDDEVDEEFLGLAEGKLLPILVAAIKELKAEFDAYKAAHQ
jgi:hypothetical protein